VPKSSIHFEEIQKLDHGNIEEQNKVFGSSKIIINYLIIILLTYSIIFIFLITFSSRKKMFEKGILKRFAQLHIFVQSPTVQGTNDKYPVNTSHSVKMFRPLYYLVATVIHIQSLRSQTSVYMFFTTRDGCRGKNIQIGRAENAAFQGNLSACHSFASAGLG
jgi:hypothetical protein